VQYFTVKNWLKHQHYKDRRPPWIKLHLSRIDGLKTRIEFLTADNDALRASVKDKFRDLREMARLVMDGDGLHSYTPGPHLTECPECCRLSDLARKYAEEGKG
jgi:hypothetical protein